jgi:hypothetical protein
MRNHPGIEIDYTSDSFEEEIKSKFINEDYTQHKEYMSNMGSLKEDISKGFFTSRVHQKT